MFSMKRLYAPLLASLISLTGCDSQQKILEQEVVPQQKRNVLETKRIFLTNNFFADNVLKVGVVSDIEGAIENAKASAANFKRENIDLVLIAGDLYENEQLRRNPLYSESKDNVKEMIEGIRPYAALGVPVFIIPGNHEEYPIYTNALAQLRAEFPNVCDLAKRSADLTGINLVGLGGYHDSRFVAPQGFIMQDKDYLRAARDIEELALQQDPLIFMTHGPPRSKGKIDYVEGFGHVGDAKLTEMLQIRRKRHIAHVHGHIHEGADSTEIYPSGASINVSSITPFNNPKKEYSIAILQFPKK